MVRPNWTHEQWFRDNNPLSDVTLLICQRKTPDLIRLTIESILRFYPDINIVVIDGNSKDESTLYLKWKSVTNPNIKVVELTPQMCAEHDIPLAANGINSHGATMNYAIRNHITTKYVLLCDSDLVIERGGFIEGMKAQINEDCLYAIGTLMLVSEEGEGCCSPKSESDLLRYAHPSCSLYNAEVYRTLKPFNDHGAPCVWNQIDAKKKGLSIGYFPIDKYVSHLSGASWCVPQTIWNNDHNVFIRPFVTFITDTHIEELKSQTDRDFDIVNTASPANSFVILHEDGVKRNVTNKLYGLRFNVCGEYVCHLDKGVDKISPDIVHLIKLQAIKEKAPNEMNVGGLIVYKRTYWQNKKSLE